MDAISKLFGGKPRPPVRVSQPAAPVTGLETAGANDELLRRLAKLRRATIASELSAANVKRKVLGAGV